MVQRNIPLEISRAQRAFKAALQGDSDRPNIDVVTGAMNRLRYGELSKSQIENIIALHEAKKKVGIEDILSASFDKTGKHRQTGRKLRQIGMVLGYMDADKDHDHASVYVPTFFRSHCSEEHIAIFERAMPVRLRRDHVEKRHLERSGRYLKYDEKDFVITLGISLIMSRIAARKMKENGEDSCAMFIPMGNRGLLLGEALAASKKATTHTIEALRRNSELQATEKFMAMENTHPGAQISITTYVGKDDIDENRMRSSLIGLFSDIMDMPHLYDMMCTVLEAYCIGSVDKADMLFRAEQGQFSAKATMLQRAQKISDYIESIINHMAWEISANSAQEHVERAKTRVKIEPPPQISEAHDEQGEDNLPHYGAA